MNLIYNSFTKEEDHKEFVAPNSEIKKLLELETEYKLKGFKTWINPHDGDSWQLVVIKKGE